MGAAGGTQLFGGDRGVQQGWPVESVQVTLLLFMELWAARETPGGRTACSLGDLDRTFLDSRKRIFLNLNRRMRSWTFWLMEASGSCFGVSANRSNTTASSHTAAGSEIGTSIL